MQRACAVFQTLLLLLVPLVLSVLTLFAVLEYAKLEQIDFGATVHASFDELEPIHIAALSDHCSTPELALLALGWLRRTSNNTNDQQEHVGENVCLFSAFNSHHAANSLSRKANRMMR